MASTCDSLRALGSLGPAVVRRISHEKWTCQWENHRKLWGNPHQKWRFEWEKHRTNWVSSHNCARFFLCGWIIIYYGCHEGLTQSHMGELGDNNGIHMINHPQVGFSTSFCWLFMIGFAKLHKLSEPQIYEDWTNKTEDITSKSWNLSNKTTHLTWCKPQRFGFQSKK